jgi:hypothetical protein
MEITAKILVYISIGYVFIIAILAFFPSWNNKKDNKSNNKK